MKKLKTKDGYIELNENDKTISLIGSVAHDVYFSLDRIYRGTGFDSAEERSDAIYDLLDDKRAIDLLEIEDIVCSN